MAEPQLSKPVRDVLERMDAAFVAIDRLLLRLAQQGLQRMTRSSVSELQALGQTAHNARLISIEREIETLSTWVERYLERDPLFTLDAYMTTINRIWLLCAMARARRERGALPDEMLDVIGEARRRYEEIELPLVLQPIGASGWVSDTDFVGVTVYFFCEGHEQLLQASNAKPCQYFGRDPRALLNQSISDYQDYAISDVAHGAFTFHRARVSADGRLSLHKDLRIEPAPWFGARAYEALAVRDWIELVERLREQQSHPVRGSETFFAHIEPEGFGALTVEQKSQRATVPVFDAQGAQLQLEVALRAENNFLIDNLERLCASAAQSGTKQQARQGLLRPDGLFGRAWVAEGQLKFFPLTAIYHEPRQLKRHGDRDFHELHLSLESLSEVR